jgi:nucleoside-diphosphate-sugar epimerase
MTASTVLITGATGHLGFRVLVLALEAGYNARVAVRNQSGADKVLAAPSIKRLNTGSNITLVTVPDILAKGAYTEAAKGVEYIIHCASPITSGITDHYEEKLIGPAVKGTTSILDAAYTSPEVKRVVITSSVVATISAHAFLSPSDEVFDGQKKVPVHTGDYASEFHAYMDSKVRALAATHDFVAEKKPRFDVINIMPSFIIGKNELVTNTTDFLNGTNKVVFSAVLGIKADSPRPGTTIYLNDVARLHVDALNPKIAGNQDFPASSGGVDGVTLNDSIEIVAKHFPKEVAAGVLPNSGSTPTLRVAIDASKTEKVFGFKFAGLEKQVVEIAEQYIALSSKATNGVNGH